jgi:hypothetical protein
MENQPTDKEIKLSFEDQTITPNETTLLEDIDGRFKTTTLIPTTTVTLAAGEYYSRPVKVSDQCVIHKNGTTKRFYWYDAVNNEWQYTSQPTTTNVVAVRVTKNDDQTFYDSIDTTITWNGETFDTDTIHDNSTNNERLTSKTAGYYQITLNLGTNNTDGYFVKIFKNTTLIAINTNSSSYSSYLSLCNLTTLIYLDVNDYVTATIQRVTLGASNIQSGQAHFEMHKV